MNNQSVRANENRPEYDHEWNTHQFDNHNSDSDKTEENDAPNWVSMLPKLLRGVGALAVVFSLYTFLARGWDTSGDLVRYFVFLGHTVALAAFGLINAKVIKEAKGARLLLMLALLSVPAIFAILGGFIFAGDSLSSSTNYPNYLSWSIGSLNNALLIATASTFILAPVVLLGFKVLVRTVSAKASLFFLASNILLLLPFRQPELVAVIAVFAASCLYYFYRSTQKHALELKTIEGKIAFLIQFLPIMILMVRSFWLYQFDAILLSCASLILFAGFRQISKSITERSLIRLALELASTLLALTCGITFGISLLDMNMPLEIIIALSTLVIAAMIYEMSTRGPIRAEIYRIFAVITLVGGMLIDFWLFSSLMSAFLLLVIGALMLISSFVFQQKSLFIGAAILLVAGFQYQMSLLLIGFEFNYWIALAVLGITLIVSGSYLEANGSSIKRWMSKNRQTIGEWQF